MPELTPDERDELLTCLTTLAVLCGREEASRVRELTGIEDDPYAFQPSAADEAKLTAALGLSSPPPRRINTKEENIEFRKRWDARVEAGKKDQGDA